MDEDTKGMTLKDVESELVTKELEQAEVRAQLRVLNVLNGNLGAYIGALQKKCDVLRKEKAAGDQELAMRGYVSRAKEADSKRIALERAAMGED